MAKPLCAALVIFWVQWASAYAPHEGNISAAFGPFFSESNFHGSESGAPSPILRGMGFIADGDINDQGALEIMLFYNPKVFMREQSNLYTSEQSDMVQIGMGYRRWLGPAWSAALLFNTTYTTGDVTIVHDDLPGGQTLDTSARDVSEYMIDLAVENEFWSNDRFSAVLNGRYSWSLTRKSNEFGDHFGILIGVRYLIQEKVTP